MYARDTSKKIRSSFKTKMQEGSFIGNFAPYGYKKDPCNKNHLIVDPEAAPVVKRIFKLASENYRPSEIASCLNESGILSPAIYRCQKHPHLNPAVYTTRAEWTSSSICKILANVVYIGHMAQGKTFKPSFKSKTAFQKPREEWCIVENTHEPLVSRELFDAVRKRSVSRRAVPKTDFQNVFSGVAKCADCGANMSTTGSRKKGSSYNLVCGRYKLHGSGECSNHFIDYNLLSRSVLLEMREMPKPETEDSSRLFYETPDGLTNLSALTQGLVKKLIDRIEISQGHYEKKPGGGEKHQLVKIFWRFTGEIAYIHYPCVKALDAMSSASSAAGSSTHPEND